MVKTERKLRAYRIWFLVGVSVLVITLAGIMRNSAEVSRVRELGNIAPEVVRTNMEMVTWSQRAQSHLHFANRELVEIVTAQREGRPADEHYRTLELEYEKYEHAYEAFGKEQRAMRELLPKLAKLIPDVEVPE